jgi:hypothetical protein
MDNNTINQTEERLMQYAKALLGNKVICDNQDKTIERIVKYQPDVVLEAYDIQIETVNKDTKPEERLSRDAAFLGGKGEPNINDTQKKRIEAYASRMESVIRAYSKYDYSKEGEIEVNGNTFTYNKELIDPENYMDDMYEVGESVKGDIFSLSVDDDGKVVIY